MTILITTTDMHTAGEPLRIITGGLPPIQGETVLERRRYFREHYDHIRTGLMWEPRGHADMYGVVLAPPNDSGADFGAFFLHNEGYSTMCGHAVIALARYAVDSGIVKKQASETLMTIDVPAGRIRASVQMLQNQVVGSSFRNVPSFVYLKDGRIRVDGLGELRFDIAYGGTFYALVNADELGMKMIPANGNYFIETGRKIKSAVIEKYQVKHPFEDDLSFLYGTIFTGAAENPANHSRNVCIFADGELDRSPTGSGVSARAALHYEKGELKIGEKITIESILGTTMDVEIADTNTFGLYTAVVPKVSGQSFYTGEQTFIFEENDPLGKGFLVR
jgi:trans-L-3-hydroxyproline dehydratase